MCSIVNGIIRSNVIKIVGEYVNSLTQTLFGTLIKYPKLEKM